MSAGALIALLLAGLACGALVAALVRVVLLMRATDRDLVSVHLLLRAVADRVEPVPPQVSGIAENVRAIDEALAQFCRRLPGADDRASGSLGRSPAHSASHDHWGSR